MINTIKGIFFLVLLKKKGKSWLICKFCKFFVYFDSRNMKHQILKIEPHAEHNWNVYKMCIITIKWCTCPEAPLRSSFCGPSLRKCTAKIKPAPLGFYESEAEWKRSWTWWLVNVTCCSGTSGAPAYSHQAGDTCETLVIDAVARRVGNGVRKEHDTWFHLNGSFY